MGIISGKNKKCDYIWEFPGGLAIKEYCIITAVAQVAAMVQIQSLVHSASLAKKKKKKKKKRNVLFWYF